MRQTEQKGHDSLGPEPYLETIKHNLKFLRLLQSLVLKISLFIMAELPPCFVNEVTEPVRVISTGSIRPNDESCASEVHQFSTLGEIKSHFSLSQSYPWHFVYVLLPELCDLHARCSLA